MANSLGVLEILIKICEKIEEQQNDTNDILVLDELLNSLKATKRTVAILGGGATLGAVAGCILFPPLSIGTLILTMTGATVGYVYNVQTAKDRYPRSIRETITNCRYKPQLVRAVQESAAELGVKITQDLVQRSSSAALSGLLKKIVLKYQ